MPVCVHCGAPNDALFVAYGPSHIVCTRCTSCAAFVDPYVEQEAFIVALDLILVKPRAYRHLLFNRPGMLLQRSEVLKSFPVKGEKGHKGKLNRDLESSSQAWLRVGRHFLALLLVDAYIRWFNADDKVTTNLDDGVEEALYGTFKAYSATLTRTFIPLLAMHAVVLAVCYFYVGAAQRLCEKYAAVASRMEELKRFRLHHVSSALLLSSLCPLFLLSLLLLWQTSPTTEKSMPDAAAADWSEDGIEWAVRTLVNGLSAGVALGVVLPLQRTMIGSAATLLSLVAGWSTQLWASHLVDRWLDQGTIHRQRL